MPRAKKTAAPAKAVETVEAAPKKAAAKKTTEEVFVQFAGREFNVAAIVADAKAAFKAAEGRKAVKTCQVYVKPEESAAYYVINGDFTGKVEL